MARPSAARRAALRIGARARTDDAYASELAAAYLDKAQLQESERAFAQVLVRGVAACCGTLDESIDGVLSSPRDIEPAVRDALRISAYELLFLGKQPHAAVSQGVDLARSVQPRAAGVANFALRRLAESCADFPFGDVEQDDAALARSQGFPLWMTQRLIAEMGRDAAHSFMQASNQAPPLFLAINALKLSEQDFDDEMSLMAIDSKPVRLGPDGPAVGACRRLAPASVVAQEPVAGMLAHGQVLASDASAQVVAALAVAGGLEFGDGGRAPTTFLEIGSGRGTKTALVQSVAKRIFGRPLRITCVDKHGFKMSALAQRAALCGFEIEQAIEADACDLSAYLAPHGAPPACFDAVLVDAPCSGLGTLRRHPETRWRLDETEIDGLAHIQLDLLSEAARYVAPEGLLTYATCTVLAQENEQVVAAFLSSPQGAAFDVLPINVDGANRLAYAPPLAPSGPDAHFAMVLKRMH